MYINDLPDCVSSEIYLFADDTKLFHQADTLEDQEAFQRDLDKLVEWSEMWLLKFHPDKCKVMTINGDSSSQQNFYFNSSQSRSELSKTKSEKDIGVMIDDKLKFDIEINSLANKANQIMGVIRRSYEYLDECNFKLLFKGLVRPHLEYAAPVWMPMYKKDITTIENVQHRGAQVHPLPAES